MTRGGRSQPSGTVVGAVAATFDCSISLIVVVLRDTCDHRDGVLPVPAAMLAAIHVQPEFVHVVIGRRTRSEGPGAGSLRAVLDSRARETVCRRGEPTSGLLFVRWCVVCDVHVLVLSLSVTFCLLW